MSSDDPPPSLLRPIPPAPLEIHSFLSRHLDLLAAERQAEVDQTNLLASNADIKLLEKRGLALGGLGVASISVGLGGKILIELHRPSAYHSSPLLPPHTFRNGDPARIEPYSTSLASSKKAQKGSSKKTASSAKVDGAEEDQSVEGVVARVTAERVVVSVDGNKSMDLPERLSLLKLANSATFDRMDQTIHRLSRIVLDPSFPHTPVFNADLIRVLFGSHPPSTLPVEEWARRLATDGSKDVVQGGLTYFDETLNDSQKKAVEFALAAREVAAIHGPPGTGKTFTLVEIIRQLVIVQKKKVLVCGASNLAVDNLLARLSPLLPPSTLLRLGHPARISRDLISTTLDYQTATSAESEIVKDVKVELEGGMKDLSKKKGEKGWLRGRERGKKWEDVRELRKEYRVREANVVKNVLAGAQVVLSTCHGAGSRQIQNMQFDVCVIDEATQAVEAVCWIPVLKAKKLILAGDPLQLPPTILSSNQKPANVKPASKPIPLPETSDAVLVSAAPQQTPAGTVQPDPSDRLKNGSRATAAGQTNAEKNGRTPTNSGSEEDDDRSEDRQLANDVDKVNLSSAERPRPRLRRPRTLETTMFDRLEKMYGPGIKRMLTVQYRMNETIAAFPSKALYLNKLISASGVAKRRLIELPTVQDPTSDDAKDVLSETLVFFDTAGTEMYERTEGDIGGKGGTSASEGSRYNENEAEVVCRWTKRLIELGIPEGEIAIITPYQAQVAHIADLLREDHPDLIIGSVDGMQGQEREAVILSLVRSNAAREVGFLSEHRRLNVAMTRAKRQLCIVGDSATVSKGSKYLKSWMDWLEEHADVRWPCPD